MHKQDMNAVAERFIKDQFAIMRKHGKAPRLDSEQYARLIADTSRTLTGLAHKPESPKISRVTR